MPLLSVDDLVTSPDGRMAIQHYELVKGKIPLVAYPDLGHPDIFTVGLNIAGVPGMSMPAGVTKAGLPVGVQLVASHFAEEKLFLAGHALEQAVDFKLKPSL